MYLLILKSIQFFLAKYFNIGHNLQDWEKDTWMFTTHSFINSMIRQDSKPDSFDQSRAREDYVYQGDIS